MLGKNDGKLEKLLFHSIMSSSPSMCPSLFPLRSTGSFFCSFLGFRSFLDSPRSFILLRPEEIDFDPLSKTLQTPPWVFLPFFRLPLFSRFRSDRSNEKKRTKGVEVVTVYHQKEKSLIIIGWALVFSPVSPPQFFFVISYNPFSLSSFLLVVVVPWIHYPSTFSCVLKFLILLARTHYGKP